MQLAGLGVGLLTLWTLTAAAVLAVSQATGAGFAVTASLYLTTAMVAAATVFAAVGAVCSQLAATRRQAATLAGAVFAATYLLRVVAYSSTSMRWLHWVSPLGWVDELRPLTGTNPWPLVPIGVTVALLVIATIALAGRRDLGAGMLPARDVRASRTKLLTGPTWLAHRLSRGSMYGWLTGLAVGGFLIGLITKGTADVWAKQSSGLLVNLADATGAKVYLGVTFLLVAFLVAMAAAGQVSQPAKTKPTATSTICWPDRSPGCGGSPGG
jgi:ABC-2 type transport system permease protein